MMAIRQVDIDEFLLLSETHPILDVRSPGEFERAHIPLARSFPLFTDHERAIVGTLYKQQGQQKAIRRGLEFFGPKLNLFIDEACRILEVSNPTTAGKKNTLLLHCWRGGMRSAGMAWLLSLYGFEVVTLKGGYKRFRHWVLEQFEQHWNFIILGGYTGSSKTEILKRLSSQYGAAIIDLEGLARHKGSAFGGIGQSEPQPTQEMFENQLAFAFRIASKNKQRDSVSKQYIWIEDESQRIGSVNIPQPMWERMKASALVFIDIPFEKRLNHIVSTYGKLDRSLLTAAISRLQKKMGGLETKTAINHLLEGNVHGSFEVLLKYYDKLYLKALDKKRDGLSSMKVQVFMDIDPNNQAVQLINKVEHE
jgi:tRNA 2-selenouridine synthase